MVSSRDTVARGGCRTARREAASAGPVCERVGPGIRRNIDGLPEVGLGDQGRRPSGTALVV